ncbi:NAD(P)H-quinone oxidoreductase [Auraticoccus monumenti]|uniref:Putative NAD(P)H quinone oxidoreductase, PIG3 family n=1 Tax=Auraticoccus monumenti TaxID=675864 RepID=A0A1G6SFT5_9ACTN|nr:NAD(P)H-quinone oxidoreductase [Auraticoccus monumenti]SDD15511.1 putative NAD(P)H quinone oxidoreductase, PIG3 family [Auraticoccus monumenti]
MRAVRCEGAGGPEVLGIGEVADPSPGPGEVLVRVRAAGVNRADLLQRQGHYPPPPGAPETLGLECSGTVAAVGAGVHGWQPGQDCVALLAGGGYAELVGVPAGQLITPPPGVDLVTAGGLVEVAATVVSNLDHAGVGAGATVLVHGGAGGIGSFAVQYARALGCRVLTTAGSADKLAYCLDLGADEAFDYHADWPAAVRAAAPGGVDAVLDVMGASYLTDNVSVLAADGHLLVIGMQGGRRGELDLGALLARRASVSALALRSRPVEQKSAICARVGEVVWPMLADGRVRPAHETRFPLEQAAEAHALLESGRSHGKIVLVV